MARLTAQNKRFCEEYIIDLNGTQAAIRAGYSERSAGSIAHDLLKKPEIKTYIQRLQLARSLRTQITADRVLSELAAVAYANVSDVVIADKNGIVITDLEELPLETQSAIAEVSSFTKTTVEGGETTSTKIKMHDKLGALKLLAQHLGVTSDFNIAVHTLAKYGLHLKQSEGGEWYVDAAASAAG